MKFAVPITYRCYIVSRQNSQLTYLQHISMITSNEIFTFDATLDGGRIRREILLVALWMINVCLTCGLRSRMTAAL